jgi:hypothetical protein
MPAKKEAKKRRIVKAPAVGYHIEVAVDINGKFTYTANGQDASTLRPKNTDTISWSATLLGIPAPFQVEFSGFSPFDQGIAVVRSPFHQSAPLTVNVPKGYHGNQVFKYRVTVANAWSDDPIVEPVPSDGRLPDGLNAAQVVTLTVDDSGLVTLSPSPASFAKGEVTWQWDPGSRADDFTMIFTNTPPGWLPLQATSQAHILALNLQTATPGGQPVTCSLQTLNTGASGSGFLSIT